MGVAITVSTVKCFLNVSLSARNIDNFWEFIHLPPALLF